MSWLNCATWRTGWTTFLIPATVFAVACGSGNNSLDRTSKNGPCNGACSSNQLCVNDGSSDSCWKMCANGTDCGSGCCATTTSGKLVCAPSADYCSSGGGGGVGGTCVTVTPPASGSCNGGVYCGNNTCCPTSAPYFCGVLNKCYVTSTDAANACGRSSCMACVPITAGGGGGSGSCPRGTYPLYQGGPCVPPTPSSCPNGEVVCNCPAEHGAWCHPPVCTAGGPRNYCGQTPSC